MASEMLVMAQYLQEMGHNVDLLTGNYEGVRTVTRSEDRVDVIYMGTLIRKRYMTVNPALVLFCLRNLRSYDVVHIYGIYDLIGPTVAWFCRRWGIPYVVEPLGMYKPIVRNLFAKRLYHKSLGRTLIRGAARIVSTADNERQDLIEGGVSEDKIFMRRNGLDMSVFENLPPRGAFRVEAGMSEDEALILFLGRLSRKKGIDLLIKAFARIEGSARLVLAGPDDQDGSMDDIEQLRSELGLGDRILVAGPRFGQKKLEILADADLFVLSSRHENFGNAPLEAAGCGIPTIVTDRCGVAPFIDGRSGTVIPFDLDALVEAMQDLLVNKEKRQQIQANAVEVRRNMSWTEPMEIQEQMYKELVSV